MKFGSREIADVYFKARANMKIGDRYFIKGQPVLHLDTCTATNLESASTTVYAQGGRGNARLIAWDGERTLTFTVTDALMSPIGFAILSGAGVVKNASEKTNIFVHTVFKAPIDKDGIVRIDLETAGDAHDVVISPDGPLFGTVLDDADAGIDFFSVPEDNIKLLPHCGTGNEGAFTQPFSAGDSDCPNSVHLDACKHQYSITEDYDLVIDFGSNGAKYSGRTMMIDCYTVRRSGAIEMLVDAEHFGGNFYVEASTLFRDQASGEDLAAEFIIPNAKIQSNFTFSMSSSGDPSTFDFVMDAFPAYTKFDKTHKCLCALQVIGGEQDAAVAGEVTCDDLRPETYPIEEILVGYDATLWDGSMDTTVVKTPGDTPVYYKLYEILGLDEDDQDAVAAVLNNFGRNLSVSLHDLDVDFFGTLISGFDPEFMEDEDKTGYYIPVAIKTSATVLDVNKDGTRAETDNGITSGSYKLYIYSVDQDSPVQSIAVGNYLYAFDFSALNFA